MVVAMNLIELQRHDCSRSAETMIARSRGRRLPPSPSTLSQGAAFSAPSFLD
ncbi:hypothetical protein AT6N2_C2726 [Agrobacterium tumefaciens]|nr:hypothetical protein AT6N2_C2726 [Agrobacterium tumefaciens]